MCVCDERETEPNRYVRARVRLGGSQQHIFALFVLAILIIAIRTDPKFDVVIKQIAGVSLGFVLKRPTLALSVASCCAKIDGVDVDQSTLPRVYVHKVANNLPGSAIVRICAGRQPNKQTYVAVVRAYIHTCTHPHIHTCTRACICSRAVFKLVHGNPTRFLYMLSSSFFALVLFTCCRCRRCRRCRRGRHDIWIWCCFMYVFVLP